MPGAILSPEWLFMIKVYGLRQIMIKATTDNIYN